MFTRPTSLRSALLLAVLVTVIPVVALNLYHAAGIRRQLQEERTAESARLAEQVAAGVSRYLEGTRQLLVALSHYEPIRECRAAAAAPLLEELRATSPLFANLSLVRSDGTIAASALPAPDGVNLADRSWFRRLQANRHIGLGEYQIGRVTGKESITMACPLSHQASAGPLDCVIAALDLQVLLRLLDDFPIPPAVELVLLDRNGTILGRRGTARASTGTPFPGWGDAPASLSLTAPDEHGRSRVFNFTLVPSVDEGLWVGIGRLETAVRHEARGAFIRSFVVSLFCVAAAMLLSWWLAERLVLRPTRKIARTASALAAGDWAARAGIARGAAELRDLGRTFDAMAEHLHGQLQQLPAGRAELVATRERLQQAFAAQHAADLALRRSEATARAFIDSLTETALLLAPDGTVLMANQTAAERLRRPLAELLGTNIAAAMSPELFARRQAHLRTVIETRRAVGFDDERQNRMLHTELAPVLDPAGAVVAIAVLSFDITERHQMEERLRRTVAKLERAIAEVDTLSGLLPICAGCKKIREDSGYWTHVESYLQAHTAAEFSHGLCPDCMRRLYPEYADEPGPPARPPDGPA